MRGFTKSVLTHGWPALTRAPFALPRVERIVEVIKYKTRVETVYVNMGCDGVPNSGLRLDACNVCGGSGQSCMPGRDPFRFELPEATECPVRSLAFRCSMCRSPPLVAQAALL